MPSEGGNCESSAVPVASRGEDVLVLDVRGRPAHQRTNVRGEALCSLLVGCSRNIPADGLGVVFRRLDGEEGPVVVVREDDDDPVGSLDKVAWLVGEAHVLGLG